MRTFLGYLSASSLAVYRAWFREKEYFSNIHGTKKMLDVNFFLIKVLNDPSCCWFYQVLIETAGRKQKLNNFQQQIKQQIVFYILGY